MRTSRREFLQTSALASLAAAHSTSVASDGRTAGISTDAGLNASEIARRHMIVRDTPSPSFFDGMLLGNGDVGACVVVRPDALAIHRQERLLGHSRERGHCGSCAPVS